MRSADRQRWAAARSLADVAELTACWLERTIESQPGYQPGYGPDPETEHLVGVLAAVNRSGYLTDSSQPGIEATGHDGALWQQRAAVSGYADPTTTERLLAAAVDTELQAVVHRPYKHAGRHSRRHSGPHAGVVVTMRGGGPYTVFGRWRSPRSIGDHYRECHPDARADIRTAWQVTLVDPVWGRDDTLWLLLGQVFD